MLALKRLLAMVSGSLRKRPGNTGAAPFWLRLAVQAEIRPVIIGGQYQRFIIHVPYWNFTVRRGLRDIQPRILFRMLINERIRTEIVDPGGVPEETFLYWNRRTEERHTVQRRLVGRWGIPVFDWHRVRTA